MPSPARPPHGFTLVELAVVLMAVGLLIAGVLKGQEMIQNARVVNFIQQAKYIDAAAVTFRSSYKALPGDIADAGTRLQDCSAAPCSTPGNDNGEINESTVEVLNFWRHLGAANLLNGVTIEGTTPATILTETSLKNYWRITYVPPHRLSLTNADDSAPVRIPSTIVAQIDKKIDDGMPSTGKIMGGGSWACFTPTSPRLYQTGSANGCFPYIVMSW